jgi:hypothetical protein
MRSACFIYRSTVPATQLPYSCVAASSSFFSGVVAATVRSLPRQLSQNPTVPSGSYLVNTHPANDLLPDQVTWRTRS